MSGLDELLSFIDNGGRRTYIERRQHLRITPIPDRRANKDRRNTNDRRMTQNKRRTKGPERRLVFS